METEIIKYIQDIMLHIQVLNDDYTALSTNVAILTERVAWLTKFFWLIMSTTIGTLVANIWQLKIMKKEK